MQLQLYKIETKTHLVSPISLGMLKYTNNGNLELL